MSGQNYVSQLLRQKGFYDSLSESDKQALTRGEWVPERLAALDASSGAEQDRLTRQLAAAQRMASAPIEVPNNSSAGVVVPTVIGNVLRTFGGALMADKQGKDLTEAQARAAAEREALIRSGESATGVTKRAERDALAAALRSFGGGM